MSRGAQISPAPRDLLRVVTAGSVDDGKSTLIGRMLFDAGAVPDDVAAALAEAARAAGRDGPDLAFLTDGLIAERAQGITIDVAYRFFSTPRRRFILADVPGHEQYTRNMVTGASTADAAVIIVDARRGPTAQTRRHLYIAALLGIRHLVVAVNKMDLVGYERETFRRVAAAVGAFGARLGAVDLRFVPVSARAGDNVVRPSARMGWYQGAPLLALLETLPAAPGAAAATLRFPVQLVSRPQSAALPDARGYMGRIEQGAVTVGEAVVVLPAGHATRIAGIRLHGEPVARAAAPQSVTLALADALDVGRGDLIVAADDVPATAERIEATAFWLGGGPLDGARRYLVRHATRTVRARLTGVRHKIDIDTLERIEDAGPVAANQVARIGLRLQSPIPCESYRRCRTTGAFIVIDEATNETVAACLVP